MYENVQILREGVEYVFERLHRTVDGLTEKELDWKPLNESNNIRWILNHISRLSNISTMIYIKGDPSYLPEGWPEDYREKQHTLEKLLGDISKGKAAVRAGLEDMKAADLLSEVTRRGTTRTRQLGLFIMISEIVHHGGQIAYLRGTIKRIREKDPQFLK